jgi:hypothetical protein
VLLSDSGERIEHVLDIRGFISEIPAGDRIETFSPYSYWINNQLIYSTMASKNPSPNISGTVSNLSKVFDPFTGVWNESILNDLPDMYSDGAFGISADLTRVLYEGNGDCVCGT